MGNKIARVWQGTTNLWYITIRNKHNGRIVADGGEGYATKATATRALRTNFGDGYYMVETGVDGEYRMRPKV